MRGFTSPCAFLALVNISAPYIVILLSIESMDKEWGEERTRRRKRIILDTGEQRGEGEGGRGDRG